MRTSAHRSRVLEVSQTSRNAATRRAGAETEALKHLRTRALGALYLGRNGLTDGRRSRSDSLRGIRGNRNRRSAEPQRPVGDSGQNRFGCPRSDTSYDPGFCMIAFVCTPASAERWGTQRTSAWCLSRACLVCDAWHVMRVALAACHFAENQCACIRPCTLSLAQIKTTEQELCVSGCARVLGRGRGRGGGALCVKAELPVMQLLNGTSIPT